MNSFSLSGVNPVVAGAHRALRLLGETEVTAIVRECVGVFGAHTRPPDAEVTGRD